MMLLSDRHWNQIKAALIFWRETAKSSRIHPMEHRAVCYLFGGENPTPLTNQEIDEILKLELVRPKYTIEQVVGGTGLTAFHIRRWLHRHHRKRAGKVGTRHLFYMDDLRDAIVGLTKYDEKKATHCNPST